MSTSTSSPTDLQLHKRRRNQLSCNDCKRQKLSCDRAWPCSRCIRQKRTCSFTTKHITADVKALVEQLAKHPDSADILAGLQRVVGQSLSFSQSVGSERSGGADTIIPDASMDISILPDASIEKRIAPIATTGRYGLSESSMDKPSLPDTSMKSAKSSAPRMTTVLYQRHMLYSFFIQIPDLYPYMKDVVATLGGDVSLVKTIPSRFETPELLDKRNQLDPFVDFFLKHIDTIYRVLPLNFEEQYSQFWEDTSRDPTFNIMLLAVLSIAVGTSIDQAGLTFAPLVWIEVCQNWLISQEARARPLTYHRIIVLVHLARRVHLIGKKDYWQDTGRMIRDAMIDGVEELDQDLWNCMCELDVQTSFEFGMPSLLSVVACPKACRLRAELSQKLFGREDMSYEEVLKYTDRISKEFMPATTLKFVLIQTQLMACLIQLHAKHVETWVSRNMVYQMSKDIIMLHEQLKDDVRAISFLREDVFLASFMLLRLSLLPETGFPGANARETSVLLWRVLPWMKERFLHACLAEPWCVLSILAIISLHTVYCGQADRQEMLQISRENYMEVYRKLQHRMRSQDSQQLLRPALLDGRPSWDDILNEQSQSVSLDADLSRLASETAV